MEATHESPNAGFDSRTLSIRENENNYLFGNGMADYDGPMSSAAPYAITAFGRHLKGARARARMSQLELSARTGVSQRHLSFIETGRSRPRSDVVLRIASALGLPLRDRNRLLEAAGLPPHYPEVRLADQAIAPFRRAISLLLRAHEPYPAIVLDRWWDVVDANDAARRLFPEAVDGVTNAVEAFLAPGGLREIVENFPEVAAIYLRRLQAEVAETSDERLRKILDRARELLTGVPEVDVAAAGDLMICPRLRIGDEVIGTVTMVARFGSTKEVTLDELRVELIFPADEAAAAFFKRAAGMVGGATSAHTAVASRALIPSGD